MFKIFTNCPKISDSANSLLHNNASSKARSTIQCYCIVHSHRFYETERTFWSVQIATFPGDTVPGWREPSLCGSDRDAIWMISLGL